MSDAPAEKVKRPASSWVVFNLQDCGLLPRRPACYVVYLDGELAYVGQSGDLAKRASAHRIRVLDSGVATIWGFFRSVVVKAHFGRTYGDWAMRELRLIRKLQPRLNCVGSTRKRGAP